MLVQSMMPLFGIFHLKYRRWVSLDNVSSFFWTQKVVRRLKHNRNGLVRPDNEEMVRLSQEVDGVSTSLPHF